MALGQAVELWPDGRCQPAMRRLLARAVATGAHGYSTQALLLDGAPDCEEEVLSCLKRTPELKARTPKLEALLTDTLSKAHSSALKSKLSSTLENVCSAWVILLVPHSDTEQASSNMDIRFDDSHPQGHYVEGSAACGRKKVHKLPPSAQQLAPLALDLVWGMEGMLQMMQRHWHMFWPLAYVEESSRMSSLFRSCSLLLVLFGHVIEVLAEPAAVGPAGLAAQPASWLPCGNSLVEGWCSQLLARVCQLFYINSPALKGPPDHIRMMGCHGLDGSQKYLLRDRQQAPTSMSLEAERLLACLTLVLTVVAPLDTWLAAVACLPAAGAYVSWQASAIHGLLTRLEPEKVWSWQALAAGTPAEASLASVLQGVANTLRLPHLVAPAPRGWQPGRLTLDRGTAPPEFLRLCFPSR
ncbi:hypothetical protein V8C86DRAFT_2478019 [Haematococcus lacustris]